MTYNETAALVYRLVSAYPMQARFMSDEMVSDMVREWHAAMCNIQPDGAMEAVTELISEQKWMPVLSEVLDKVLDIQYGTDGDIIRAIDKAVLHSSTYIIFGQVTQEQRDGFEKLPPFMKQIVGSPYEFSKWLSRSYEKKVDRVKLVKRSIRTGKEPRAIGGGFDVFRALEERKDGQVAKR